MHIAILSTSYPQCPGDAGGLFVQTEALELGREGHVVHVLAPGAPRGSTDPDACSSGEGVGRVTVCRLGARGLFGSPGAIHRARESPLRALQAVPFMARAGAALRRLRPQRIIAHFVVPCAYPLALGTPGELDVVLHGSDARLVCALPAALRGEVARALLARGATLRFSSDHLRAAFLDRMPRRMRPDLGARSRVVLPSLTVPGVLVHRSRTLGRTEAWVTCGRLIPSKRIDRVIREAARRGAHLTVVGDGPERDRLRALANRLLPDARFVGHVPHEQALAHMAAADRLVHFSALESAPSVIREARAMGVPVLATAAGDVAVWAAQDPGIQLFEVLDDTCDNRTGTGGGRSRG